MKRRTAVMVAITTLATALVLLMTVPLWWTSGLPDDFGRVVYARTASDAGVLRPRERQPRLGVRIPIERGRLRDLEPTRGGPIPVEVALPRVGVRAPVVPVGIVAGTTEIPADVDTVGWYRYGPTPGDDGSAVLVGHVDSPAAGLGAFAALIRLAHDDRVDVTMSNGATQRFRVVARRTIPKDALPDELFRRTGQPTLTLITCGGTFDPEIGRYTSNVVVEAVLRRGTS